MSQTLTGFDCSHFQTVDWSTVQADFVFAKASQGTTFIDPTYAANKEGARAKGIPFGSYHYYAGGDPVAEADFFLQTVGDILPGEMLALDFEITISNPVEMASDFINEIKNKVGFYPLFYSYSSLVTGNSWGDVMNCGLWIADPDTPPRIGAWSFYAFHQYTTIPSYPGVTGSLDMDYFNGDKTQLKAYGKPAPVEAPTPSEPINVPPTVENVTTGQITAQNPTPQVETQTTIPTTIQPSTDEVQNQIIQQITDNLPQSFWSKLVAIIKSIFSKI